MHKDPVMLIAEKMRPKNHDLVIESISTNELARQLVRDCGYNLMWELAAWLRLSFLPAGSPTADAPAGSSASGFLAQASRRRSWRIGPPSLNICLPVMANPPRIS